MGDASSEQILEIPAHLLNWEHHERYVDSADSGLSDTTRAKAVAAIRALRQIFGDAWLNSAVRECHPLLQLAGDRTLFNFTLLTEVADAMRVVQIAPGAEGLIARLGRRLDWTAALPELDLTCRLVENGYPVILSPLAGNVRPDIRVAGNRPVYFEVSTVHPGSDPAVETLHELLPAIMAVGDKVAISGHVHLPILRREIPFVRVQIKQHALEAELTGETQHLTAREFTLDFVPRDLLQDCEVSFREAACAGIAGRGSRATPIDRIARRLAEEAHQVPDGAQGIIVLYDFVGAEEAWFPYIVERLTADLAELRDIAAAVFVTRHALRDVPNIGVEEASFGWMIRRPAILPILILDCDPCRPRIGRETALVIRNERTRQKLDSGILLNGLRTARLAL